MLKENLNELNIFALRDLARKTGVVSPTSKKKEQLIEEIVEIVSGKKEPQIKTKQGRPPKVFGYSFANVFNEQNLFVENKQTLNQKKQICDENNSTTIAGWLELVNNNSALLWVEKGLTNLNYFVPNEILRNLMVKMGDRVVAEILADGSSNVVQKIFSINDYPVMKPIKDRVDFSTLNHVVSSRVLKFSNNEFNNLNLNYGENIYLYGSNNIDNTKKVVEMMNCCEILNKIYINTSVVEKNKIYLKEIVNCEKFVSNLTDNIDVARRVVSLAIERAKRLLELGEDCLIVLDDVNSISAIDKDDLNLVKNLVALTKNCKEGSITLFAIIPDDSQKGIEKLADKRLVIKNGEIV